MKNRKQGLTVARLFPPPLSFFFFFRGFESGGRPSGPLPPPPLFSFEHLDELGLIEKFGDDILFFPSSSGGGLHDWKAKTLVPVKKFHSSPSFSFFLFLFSLLSMPRMVGKWSQAGGPGRPVRTFFLFPPPSPFLFFLPGCGQHGKASPPSFPKTSPGDIMAEKGGGREDCRKSFPFRFVWMRISSSPFFL